MFRVGNEKRAFYLFLLWVIFVVVVAQPHLAAQDEDMFVVEDEVAADAGPGAGNADNAKAVKSADLADDSDTPIEEMLEDEGIDENADPAELPALSADPGELLARLNGVAKSGKHSEVVEQLQEHEDVVAESKELLEMYVEALIKADKVDWNKANRFARMLSGKDKNSSLANYTQGMYFLNIKKPDTTKAITFLGKAKSAKNPYTGVAMAYYLAIGKKAWPIALIVILLPVAVIIKKKKAAKTVEINLDFATTSSVTSPDDTSAGALPPEQPDEPVKPGIEVITDPAADATENGLPEEAKKEVTVKKVKRIVTRKVIKTPTTAVAEPDVIEDAEPTAPAVIEPEPVEQPEQIEPVAIIEPTPRPPYRPEFGGNAAEIANVHEISRPGRPAAVTIEPELDALWSDLSRKAMRGHISPQYRREDQINSSLPAGSQLTGNTPGFIDSQQDEIAGDVSIDLSEESLKDDLVCKLKMMAISDSEMRELFAQKNQRHIPHLIEYIMTRPEPVRLAFVAREMGNYEDPAVIDVLASLMYHEDHRVALAAIQGLEKSKKNSAILHLCPFLRSEIPLLSQAARTALASFGAMQILQAFKNLSTHPDEKIREAGIFVLSRMQGKAVEEMLTAMLNDDSLAIRKSVILAMSYQKKPAYIDVLRDFFRSATDEDKTLARKAIVYLQGFVPHKK